MSSRARLCSNGGPRSWSGEFFAPRKYLPARTRAELAILKNQSSPVGGNPLFICQNREPINWPARGACLRSRRPKKHDSEHDPAAGSCFGQPLGAQLAAIIIMNHARVDWLAGWSTRGRALVDKNKNWARSPGSAAHFCRITMMDGGGGESPPEQWPAGLLLILAAPDRRQ